MLSGLSVIASALLAGTRTVAVVFAGMMTARVSYSKGQRRLQCSLSFKNAFKYLAPEADPKPQETPRLFGVPAPGPFRSAPRQLELPVKSSSAP